MEILKRFKNEKGQGLVEYGLILALVSVVAVGTIGGVGDKVSANLFSVDSALSGGIYTEEEIDYMVNVDNYIPVSSADDLNHIRKNELNMFGDGSRWKGNYTSGLDKKYIQVKNIDLGGVDNWSPIGRPASSYDIFNNNEFSHPFKGEYDGGWLLYYQSRN